MNNTEYIGLNLLQLHWRMQLLSSDVYYCKSETFCSLLLVLSDLTWIQVRNAEEAWKIVKSGRRNQSIASTHLNQNSSRR